MTDGFWLGNCSGNSFISCGSAQEDVDVVHFQGHFKCCFFFFFFCPEEQRFHLSLAKMTGFPTSNTVAPPPSATFT